MPEILSHWNSQTAMQQPTDHFSTASSPATGSLIQQAQPSAATAAASAPTGSTETADNNGHDYKTVSKLLNALCKLCAANHAVYAGRLQSAQLPGKFCSKLMLLFPTGPAENVHRNSFALCTLICVHLAQPSG